MVLTDSDPDVLTRFDHTDHNFDINALADIDLSQEFDNLDVNRAGAHEYPTVSTPQYFYHINSESTSSSSSSSSSSCSKPSSDDSSNSNIFYYNNPAQNSVEQLYSLRKNQTLLTKLLFPVVMLLNYPTRGRPQTIKTLATMVC